MYNPSNACTDALWGRLRRRKIDRSRKKCPGNQGMKRVIDIMQQADLIPQSSFQGKAKPLRSKEGNQEKGKPVKELTYEDTF